MKKLHLTQDELLEYGKASELFWGVSPLLEMLAYTGDQLPEDLWDCTDSLADCLQEVKEKTLEYLRSKDKLFLLKKTEQDNEPDAPDWEFLFGINKYRIQKIEHN